MSKELKEAIKEGLRVVVLAIIPVIIATLTETKVIDFKLVLVAGTVAFLRFVDSWLHKTGKAEGGLTRF